MEISSPGRLGTTLPELDVPQSTLPNSDILRKSLNLPEVSESQLVRYFANLSQLNFSIDTNFYPLGSCTMKYNPKLHDEIAAMPGFANIHPDQPAETVQGALHIMYELEQMLLKITGMTDDTLQLSGGSQGEFAGLLIMKKYHDKNGANRKYIIIPETAHGTNPASVVLS